MGGIKNTVKIFLKQFGERFSVVEEIKNDEDYYRVKKWVKKTKKSYKKSTIVCTILATLLTVGFSILLNMNGFNSFGVALLGGLMFVLGSATFILVGWSRTTMKMHSKDVAKSAWKAAKFGYQIGETIQTTHVNIKHEFENTYKVSSRTENKGLLFACIAMFCIMCAWGGYCTYKGTFLTFKKIKSTQISLDEYRCLKSNI